MHSKTHVVTGLGGSVRIKVATGKVTIVSATSIQKVNGDNTEIKSAA